MSDNEKLATTIRKFANIDLLADMVDAIEDEDIYTIEDLDHYLSEQLSRCGGGN